MKQVGSDTVFRVVLNDGAVKKFFTDKTPQQCLESCSVDDAIEAMFNKVRWESTWDFTMYRGNEMIDNKWSLRCPFVQKVVIESAIVSCSSSSSSDVESKKAKPGIKGAGAK